MFGAAKRDRAFKDYCLILQVHPEADAAMVDAAYWHLAKRYNAAAAYDSQAKAKLEELNEAYIVLGSAEKREEYMKIRAEVLGEGALPQAPRPVLAKPPLSVMARQRPRERAMDTKETRRTQFPVVWVFVGAVVFLGLVGVVLAAITWSVIAAALVGVCVVSTVAGAGVVASLLRLRARARASTRRPTAPNLSGARDAGQPLEKIRVQADQLRRVAAQPEDAPVEIEPAQGLDADSMHELEPPAPPAVFEPAVLPDVTRAPTEGVAQEPRPPGGGPVKYPGHDQFAQIRRQAEQFRRIAESQGEVGPDAPNGTTAQTDPEQLAKIRQQTERLKSIAAKFNAAKIQPTSDPSEEDKLSLGHD